MFVVAYPREMQKMVLDVNIRAFAFFGGVPARLIYDNLKTVVDAVFVGKERQFNRRFITLANHYLFETVKSVRYQLKIARFPIHRDLLGINLAELPHLQMFVEQLETAAFMETAHNLILVDGTGN
jgi:hypothetical protein